MKNLVLRVSGLYDPAGKTPKESLCVDDLPDKASEILTSAVNHFASDESTFPSIVENIFSALNDSNIGAELLALFLYDYVGTKYREYMIERTMEEISLASMPTAGKS